MTFKDMSSWKEEVYTTTDLFKQWKVFKEEDPFNHAEVFKNEMFEILMATVNGRNDLIITDKTPEEISRLIEKLRKTIK